MFHVNVLSIVISISTAYHDLIIIITIFNTQSISLSITFKTLTDNITHVLLIHS